MSQLTQNTTDLDALIAKAQALPDAGGGSGFKTCTLTVSTSIGSFDSITATTIVDGTVSYNYKIGVFETITTYTIENALCDSAVHIYLPSASYPGFDLSGGASIINFGAGNFWIKVPSEAGAIGSASIYDAN